MKKGFLVAMFVLLVLGLAYINTVTAQIPSWQSSPYNWQNSPYNWENSPSNWRNSPNNWENSPNRYDNERIIRDQDGKPWGYVVPKTDGGFNIFDFEAKRRGYLR